MSSTGRYIEIINGVPRPVEPVSKQTLTDLLPAALGTAYKPKTEKIYTTDENGKKTDTGRTQIIDSEYRFCNPDGTWMTKAEVGALKMADAFADGDLQAFEKVSDRMLGKPKQITETTHTVLTLQDHIAARQMQIEAQRSAIEAEYRELPLQQLELMTDEQLEAMNAEAAALADDDDMAWL